MRLALKTISILLKDAIHYPNRVVVDTLQNAARCGTLLWLYSYVYKIQGGNILGTSYSDVSWSMFFYFAFCSFRLRDIAYFIIKDVQSGSVANFLSKPINYLFYKACWQVGLGLYSFLVVSLSGFLLLYFMVGNLNIEVNAAWFFSFLTTFVFGIILSLLLYGIVGLFSFWLEDASPVHWLIDKSVMILGGSYLPVALFPAAMKNLAIYSPMGASQFITHTTYSSWASVWQKMIFIQFFWIIILSIIISIMFSFANKKISINGG